MGNKLLITKDGRECEKCKLFYAWEFYSKNKRNKTGYQCRCKMCSSVNAATYAARKVKAQAPEPGFSYKIQCFCLAKAF